MQRVLIHYGEISLKGKNKIDFEKKLIQNIRKSAKKHNIIIKYIERKGGVAVIDFEDDKKDLIIKTLLPIFGIKNFAFMKEIEKTPESLNENIREILKRLKNEGYKTFSFKTKRADKNFPLKSPDINNEFRYIAEVELDLKVDYKNYDIQIFTDITFTSVFMYSEKIQGFGGLPVGSVGRVLCLLSAGIDSPVAAYNMMRRGCMVDYLHIHSFANNQLASEGRIKDTIEILNKYRFKSKLYLVPYSVYEFNTLRKIDYRYELILFKYYILKLCEKIANLYHYDAIVTGDNLAQVASQTMENLKVTSSRIKLMIFRPLLTYEKEEIINIAKKIGTFDESIKDYKDCCSLVAKNPTTKAKEEKFEKVLEIINVDELVEKSIEEMQGIVIS